VFVTCFNRFEGVGEEMTRGCVLTTFLYGRLHRERRKTERERKGKCFPHYITGPTTQREEVLRERKIKLNF
jgi:hypothetical protein